jgi:hypothetical protein
MLYDKRWDGDQVRDAFVAWLLKEPADKSYYYYDSHVCACAQFCRKTRSWYDWFWRYGRRAAHEHEVWQRFDILAGYRPHTFGALLERVLEDQAVLRRHNSPQW